MKKRLQKFTYLFICMSLILAGAVFYTPATVKAESSSPKRLADYADLLSDTEESLLTEQLDKVSKKCGVDVVALTIENAQGYDLEDFTDSIHDSDTYSYNCIILVINMDPDNREVLVKGFYDCYKYINEKRANHIAHSMVSDMKDQKYYKAIEKYVDSVSYFYDHKKPVPTPLQLVLEIAGSILLGGIIVFIMVRNSGGKDTTTCGTYLDNGNSRILAKQDIYTHTTTTRHKIESNNSHGGSKGSSGGGGAGRASF